MAGETVSSMYDGVSEISRDRRRAAAHRGRLAEAYAGAYTLSASSHLRSQLLQNLRMQPGDLEERFRRPGRLPAALFPVLKRANGHAH
jgi:hypothetical protein